MKLLTPQDLTGNFLRHYGMAYKMGYNTEMRMPFQEAVREAMTARLRNPSTLRGRR